ncbi:MAG: Glutamyl-tRNA(Gln) amidotransferase subunit E [Methanoregula sp. PtaU1.Bin051]|nr:MAG: Glutamyl-tRNA(Gln) amidotransferase subunit E [Methanoregula sp. PtaU1.Bin051]
MDYKALGLTAGIEIHQQLDTGEKLFCRCPTTLRETSDHSGEFFRYLRATESELGEIDRAAQEEMKRDRKFVYYTYDTTCLVENDEEPPAPLNAEALDLCLTIAKMFSMTPVPQLHTMRKLVIDGSNTSGFQRTALVALNGTIPQSIVPGGGEIETICLEEEAAQRVKDDIFSLDRLGIPLVEITTSPCMHTPEEVQKAAEYIGMVLRSTGKVKRGIGTIRQDVNISIAGGARVEIKGVQELDLLAEVVRREAVRQTNLLALRDGLVSRGAVVDEGRITDVTGLFKDTKSAILKKAKKIEAVTLPGFAGLVGREIQPGRRLGSEISDYAKKCGVGGIFHTDELPAYGITDSEVARLRAHCKAGEADCVILAAGASAKQAACAMQQVIVRARMALSGVPEETRKMLEGGSTAYMRPLPGAARMYPETDVLPVLIDEKRWNAVAVPELLTEKVKRVSARFVADYRFNPAFATQVASSEYLPRIERAIHEGINPDLAASTIVRVATELRREGTDIENLFAVDTDLKILHAVKDGKMAKEAIKDVFLSVASGTTLDDAIAKLAPAVSREELERIVRKILAERADFVQQKQKAALGPLMGVVMAEVRGSVDGKVVSEILRKELDKVLAKGN